MGVAGLSRRVVLAGAAGLVLSGAGIPAAEAQSIKDRVLAEGKITIGIHNRWPWGFKTETGEVAGVSPDMVRAVLGPIGVKNVEFVIADWGALIPSLISRRIDAIASGMAITPERCKQVIFSNPDLAIGDGILVKQGNPLNIHSYADIVANPAIRFAGGRGSSNSENAVKAGVPKDRLQLFPDVESGVAALLAGRIDAITFSTGTAIGVLNDPNIKGIERALPFKGLVENGRDVANYAAIAFRPEDAELRDLYDKSLVNVKADGTEKAIFVKYGFSDAEIAPPDVTAASICAENYR